MRVVVLGGGVIGVTTAYFLAADGHEVEVVERHPELAMEASARNAGIIAPGHVYAWASPRAPAMLLRSLWRDDTALRLRPRLDPRLWAWGLRFLAHCTAARNRANTLVKLRLCRYSQQVLARLADELALEFDHVDRGALYLYHDPEHFALGVANMALLNDHGLALEAITPDACVDIEPALADTAPTLAGAIYAPSDASGNSRAFARALAARAEGVHFRTTTTVKGLRRDGDRVVAALTDAGEIGADAFVLALGCQSPGFAPGDRLPIYPVKGYSLTVPVGPEHRAPTVPCVDETHLVAVSRLGDRLRATATAEFTGFDESHTRADVAPMVRALRALYPQGGDYDAAETTACLRPMTPDGPPVLGRGRCRNLWYNTGHGHMGWTMAAGSARLTADLIAGREPAIDLAGLTVERY